MKYLYLLLIAIFSTLLMTGTQAQNPGDTLRVQAWNFNSTTRDTVISFPDLPNVTFEKIFLKYTMRCKDGLVSTGSQRNLGCGEWDYSCNTYLVDSSKIEQELRLTPSHHITNYTGTSFPYKETPVYDYFRGEQTEVTINSTTSETAAEVGSGNSSLGKVLETDKLSGKTQFLYTAAELNAAGLSAGDIHGLALEVLSASGEAEFLKIRLKHTTKTDLEGAIEFDDFTEVYYHNTVLNASQLNRFQFKTPFNWDGTSNLLVEFSFTNLEAGSLTATGIEGESTMAKLGLSATNGQELLLSNNAYVECDNYTGVGGSQNRTVEAWIKTSSTRDAEICSWGANTTGEKWVFRLTGAGNLRVEITGTGTVSRSTVNDGEWHHVACVLNGDNASDIRFYIDGVLDDNSTTGNGAINTNATDGLPVRISRGVNNRYLDAEIDELRVWDTNLDGTTINDWMRRTVDASHPDYANLQLYYEFAGSGKTIDDSSVHSRTASLIGSEYRTGYVNGVGLFKDFTSAANRPNITFYQGDYNTTETTTQVDRPFVKSDPHFVTARTIQSSPPDQFIHDVIIDSEPVQYWFPTEDIYDEETGAYLTQNLLYEDDVISVTNLEYFRRFPFYNELVSFVTPYGIGLDFGLEGKSWYFDMSDYVHILKGDKRLLMTLGGQWQEDMDLEFLFVVGTPPRDVMQYEQIWQGTNRIGHARINDLVNDTKMTPQTLSLDADVSTFVLKSSITGHGAEGEFQQNGGVVNHRILIDQVQRFSWSVQQECSLNPIYPQGGTWVYDRQGWCPGERSLLKEQDITSFVTAGSDVTIDYTTTNPSNPSGDYRYHVAHQLVGYGPANHQLDASVTGIIAPNNLAEYTRVGTVCANPQVIIQNTGATPLTQLTINYWINDAQTPQSYEWTGNLAFMEEEVVTIPSPRELWMDIQGDNNKFYVEVASPNQGTDEYSFNNKFASAFDVPEVLDANITIEFRTNNRPSENDYQLIDGQGNVIGANDLPQANTVYRDDYNLTDECYKLIVTDRGGDGLRWWANPNQGNGLVTIKDDRGIFIKTFETDFGGGFEYSFTTDFVLSAEEVNFLTSIKVFPNPAQELCTVEAEDLRDAEVYLTNVVGQRVPSSPQQRGPNAVSFNLQHLSAGVYFVVIEKADVRTSRKVIVE